jgi:hypothetical protein
MLVALMTALAGAGLGDYIPALQPLSFDPDPRNLSYVSVDSTWNGSSWSEVADSRYVQVVSALDATYGRPTAVKKITVASGVADTSNQAYTWLTGEVFKTLQLDATLSGFPVTLSLASSATSAAVDSTTQKLSLGSSLTSPAVVSRDSTTWNSKGNPLYVKIWEADTTNLTTDLLGGIAPTLLESQVSNTSYASGDSIPVYRLNQAKVGTAWNTVDSSVVTLSGGVPSILVRKDATGLVRDSLAWNGSLLASRTSTDSTTEFAYDNGGRVLTRTTYAVSGATKTAVSRRTYAYDAANLAVSRRLSGVQLTIVSNQGNRSVVIRLDRSELVRVSVYGMDGRLIGPLADGQLPAGTSTFSLNGIRGAAVVKVVGAGVTTSASLVTP